MVVHFLRRVHVQTAEPSTASPLGTILSLCLQNNHNFITYTHSCPCMYVRTCAKVQYVDCVLSHFLNQSCFWHAYLCVCTYRTCLHTYVCVLFMYVCVYVCTCMCMYIIRHACTYTYKCVCVCTLCVYVHVYTHFSDFLNTIDHSRNTVSILLSLRM